MLNITSLTWSVKMADQHETFGTLCKQSLFFKAYSRRSWGQTIIFILVGCFGIWVAKMTDDMLSSVKSYITVCMVHLASIKWQFGKKMTFWRTFSLVNYTKVMLNSIKWWVARLTLVVTLIWRLKPNLLNHQNKITDKCTTYTVHAVKVSSTVFKLTSKGVV